MNLKIRFKLIIYNSKALFLPWSMKRFTDHRCSRGGGENSEPRRPCESFFVYLFSLETDKGKQRTIEIDGGDNNDRWWWRRCICWPDAECACMCPYHHLECLPKEDINELWTTASRPDLPPVRPMTSGPEPAAACSPVPVYIYLKKIRMRRYFTARFFLNWHGEIVDRQVLS